MLRRTIHVIVALLTFILGAGSVVLIRTCFSVSSAAALTKNSSQEKEDFSRPLQGTVRDTGLTADSSTESNAEISGIYTDMYYVDEAGDLLGMEVFIVGARGGYYATVQIAEGSPDPPLVVPVSDTNNQIEFTLPEYGHYKGVISAKGLRGKFDKEEEPYRLKQKKR